MSKEKKDTVSVEAYTASYCQNKITQEVSDTRQIIINLNNEYNAMKFENAKEKDNIKLKIDSSIESLQTYITELEALKFEGDE